MSMVIGELIAFCKMDSTSFEGGAAATESRLSAISGKMGTFGTIAAGVGIGAAVAAVSFVKMAGDYESSTNRLITSAGESSNNIKMVREGMLALAGQVGFSAEELSAAMYKVESGGQHGAAGLTVLKAAAQGAKAEGADLTVVSDALTSAMTDYHLPADKAADVTSKLVAATSQGKMSFEQLAGSLNAVLPVASANHISLNDILGDMASMTVHGISARQAADNMANAIRNMSGGNAVASKELAALGLNATELSASLGKRGLSGTMEVVSNAIMKGMGPDSTKVVVNLRNALNGLPPNVQKVGEAYLSGNMSLKQFHTELKAMDPIAASQAKSFAALVNQSHGIGKEAKSNSEIYQSYTQALGKATGGATGLNVALMLTGENLATTKNAIKVVSGATADAAGNVHGWDEIQGTFNQKLAEAKAGVGAMAISIGTYLLPVASRIAGVFADASHFLTDHKGIAQAVAYILGVVMVASISVLIGKIVLWGIRSTATFVADGAKGALWLATKLFQFAAASTSAVISGAITAAAWVAANIAMIAATGGIILAIGALILIGYEIVKHWQGIKDAAGAVWNWIKDAFWASVHGIGDAIGALIGFVGSIPGRALSALGDFGHLLWDAGSRLIGGLIGGITSAVGGVVDTIGNVVNTIKDHLPFSPAKMGPLSGLGSPELSGKSIGQMLSDGMRAKISEVRSAAFELAGTIKLTPQQQSMIDTAKGVLAGNSGPSVAIENFHVPNAVDERKLAEEFDWLAKGRGF